MTTKKPTGMRAFTILWLGQLFSLIGTAMTGFAIPIYVFGETNRVQELALLGMAFMVPLLALAPFAGAIVDRYSRKKIMIISDLASGLSTVVVFVLVATGQLEIWHLYITNFINGAFQAAQWPAYSATISVMVPKEQYGRANAMVSLAESGSGILAPVFAAGLLGLAGLEAVLIFDIVTFIVAVAVLALMHIPQPARTAEGAEGQGSLLQEAAYGFRYIVRRPSLLGLQMTFFVGNFLSNIAFIGLVPMILSRTGNDPNALGIVQSVGGVGGVLGGLALSVWGGPKRRVHGVLLGWFMSGVGTALLGLGRTVPVWAAIGFVTWLLIPVINTSNQAIWQAKVAPDVQGRVFSARRLIAWVSSPAASLVAIPLADSLFAPAMMEGGMLADTFGWLVGVGPGAGYGLMLFFGGLAICLVGLGGYLFPAIRNAEDLLPDHVAAVVEEQPAGVEVEGEAAGPASDAPTTAAAAD